MTHLTHIEPMQEFAGDAGLIVGDAHYDIDFRHGEWVCELVKVQIDGLSLTRDQVAMVCSKAGVERGEARIREQYGSDGMRAA